MKSSRIKAEIGRLIMSWKRLCDVQTECASDEQQSATTSNDVQGTSKSPQMAKSKNLPNFKAIHQWTKDISPIRRYWFMKLYQYLINSTDSTFDRESMRVFKSLKAYKSLLMVWSKMSGHIIWKIKMKRTLSIFSEGEDNMYSSCCD